MTVFATADQPEPVVDSFPTRLGHELFVKSVVRHLHGLGKHGPRPRLPCKVYLGRDFFASLELGTITTVRTCERLRQHILRDETPMTTLRTGDGHQHVGGIALRSATAKAFDWHQMSRYCDSLSVQFYLTRDTRRHVLWRCQLQKWIRWVALYIDRPIR